MEYALINSVECLFIEAEQQCIWKLDREKTDMDDEAVRVAVFGNNNYLSYQHEIALNRVLDDGIIVLSDTMQEVWDSLE